MSVAYALATLAGCGSTIDDRLVSRCLCWCIGFGALGAQNCNGHLEDQCGLVGVGAVAREAREAT